MLRHLTVRNFALVEHLDIDFDVFDGDVYTVTPTEAGRRWGLDSWWIGPGTTEPTQVSEVPARDELGRAAAWVKRFGGPAGTGFVMTRPTTSESHLVQILRIAEYGFGQAGPGD